MVFYKERKGKNIITLLVFIIVMTVYAGEIAVAYVDPTGRTYPTITSHLRVIFSTIWAFTPNFWCAYSLLKDYVKYKKVDIIPWIKMRYLIAGISHLSWATLGIGSIIARYVDYSLAVIYLTVIVSIFTIGSFIAWTMPKPLKRFFNRHYGAIDEEDISEEEIMKLRQERSTTTHINN